MPNPKSQQLSYIGIKVRPSLREALERAAADRQCHDDPRGDNCIGESSAARWLLSHIAQQSNSKAQREITTGAHNQGEEGEG